MRRVLTSAMCIMLFGCGEEVVPAVDDVATAVSPGETRSVELRFMRLDVDGFKNELTLEELRAMPRRVLADVWLADLDVTALMVNSLEKLKTLTPEEVA